VALGDGTGTIEFGDEPADLGDAIETTGWLDVMIGATPGRGLADRMPSWRTSF
jgi:hypothetical protein